jgi:hypothetical protein
MGFTKTFAIRVLSGLVAASALTSSIASAAEAEAKASGEDLASAATNPVSNLVQVRLQDQYSPSSYNADSYSNAMLVQAVVPLPGLASKFDSLTGIVTRTTVGYISTPQLEGIGRKNGIGDISHLAFAVPKASPEKTVWGVGPAFTIPTAGDNEFVGAGQWQAGIAAVVMVAPSPKLQWGGLVFNQKDFAQARSNAKDVNQLFVQPILNIHFDDGWYIALPDSPQTYDFETNNWTLNLGGVVGRVFAVGSQPMQIFGGAYYNSEEHDDVVSAEWTMKVSFGFLFP